MGRLVLWFLLVLQTIALVGAMLLARQYYIRSLETRAEPANNQVHAQANASLPAKSQWRVVLFGDSRVSEWSPLPPVDGVEFVNRGINGETTAQMRFGCIANIKEGLVSALTNVNVQIGGRSGLWCAEKLQ